MGNFLAGADDDKRVYEDFEPSCRWHRKENQDTLDIDLPGFKKDQLHVEVNKSSLRIWGEKPVDPPKWQRFRKEVKLERRHKGDEVSSRLSVDGVLSITIPKGPTLVDQLLKFGGSNWVSKAGIVVSVLNLLLLLMLAFVLFNLCYNKNKK